MLKRQRPSQRYLSRVLVSSEGTVTEPDYLFEFGRRVLVDQVNFTFFHGKDGSSPDAVLQRMKEGMESTRLRPGDEVWLVLDRDRWTDEQIRPLLEWASKPSGGITRRIALSNPKFELWLLLHFEPVVGNISAHEVDGRLSWHIPGYDKRMPREHITLERVSTAIANGTSLNGSCFTPLSRNSGTGMVEMVANMLRKSGLTLP